MQAATKGEIVRDARELLEALNREKITGPRSINVTSAMACLRITLDRLPSR